MTARPPRPAFLVLSLGLALVLIGRSPTASGQTSGQADFSGTWALKDEGSDDLFRDRADKAKEGEASSGGARRQGGRSGGGSGGGSGRAGSGGGAGHSLLGELPMEALVNAGLLVITDEGSTVQVTYSPGRKRVFHLDGDERELDEGGGPAKVTAKRKGAAGEKIVVSSKWSNGRSLTETWELLGNPRRIAVNGKASGLMSFQYQRVYEPAPPQPEATAAPPVMTPAAEPAPASAEVHPTPAESPAGLANCSIRPPRGSSLADLARLAKITRAEAEKRAIASVAPLRISSVISSDVEVDEGCLVWTFDLRLPDKGGVQEVFVDAGDGKVLASSFEAQNRP